MTLERPIRGSGPNFCGAATYCIVRKGQKNARQPLLGSCLYDPWEKYSRLKTGQATRKQVREIRDPTTNNSTIYFHQTAVTMNAYYTHGAHLCAASNGSKSLPYRKRRHHHLGSAMTLEAAMSLRWQAWAYDYRRQQEHLAKQQQQDFPMFGCNDWRDDFAPASGPVTARPAKRVKRKQVRFAPTATVTALRAPTDEDARNSWYTLADYRAFQSDSRRIVQTLCQAGGGDPRSPGQQQRPDEEEITAVGLEHCLRGRRQTAARRLRTRRHRAAVLEALCDVRRFGGGDGASDPALTVRLLSERYADRQAPVRADRLAASLSNNGIISRP